MTVQLTTFLSMNGRAKEAISFYQEYLKAKVLFIKNYVCFLLIFLKILSCADFSLRLFIDEKVFFDGK